MRNSIRQQETLRAFLAAAATVATIVFNGLAATGRVNGITTAEVSDRFPTVLTPAGFAFSIWGLIYLGLIAFSLYQLLPSQIERFRGIRTLYLASCFLNCVWIFFWQRLSVDICFFVIAVLAVTLTAVLVKIGPTKTAIEAVMTKGVFGLYAGWVTAAVFVNFLVMLKYLRVEWTDAAFTVIGIGSLLLAAGAAVAARFWLKNYLFPLSIAWAATGIAVKQSQNTAIIVASAIVVIVGLVLAISFVMEEGAHEL